MQLFYGKSFSDPKTEVKHYHLLDCHCIDVASCASVMITKNLLKTQSIAKALDMDDKFFKALMCCGCLIHDLGKVSFDFQKILKGDLKSLSKIRSHLCYAIPLFEAVLEQKFKIDDFDDISDLRSLCYPFLIHHGRVNVDSVDSFYEFSNAELDKAYELCKFALASNQLSWQKLLSWFAESNHRDLWEQNSWYVAAIVVIADWLGSSKDYFKFVSKPLPLTDYLTVSLQQAKSAVLRLPNNIEVVSNLSFSQLFPVIKHPSPMQQMLTNIDLEASQHIIICEDVTGSGKTEAAIECAYRLLTQNAQNIIFALPTRATANGIYDRLASCYQKIYNDDKASLLLAYGQSYLNPKFANSIDNFAVPPSPDEQELFCNGFLASNLKTSLLANVVVCTIDQVVLSILKGTKHQALRMLGLKNAVLIIDEVHSYDEYVNILIERLIEYHVSHGGSVILLSATITTALRSRLLHSFAKGCNFDAPTLINKNAFPLISHLDNNGKYEEILPKGNNKKLTQISFLNDFTKCCNLCVQQAHANKCVLWVRNTVRNAVDAYLALKGMVDDSSVEVMLFHSRYTALDRNKREQLIIDHFGKHSKPTDRACKILIATQVVEQSLDLDFDEMISDIAPIELILQRAGRLHRHKRDAQGLLIATDQDLRGDGCLHIFAPVFSDDPGDDYFADFRGTTKVYNNLQTLWLTQKILQEKNVIVVPDDTRALIESVYASHDLDLFANNQDQVRGRQEIKRLTARQNSILANTPYDLSIDNLSNDTSDEVMTRWQEVDSLSICMVQKIDDHYEPLYREGSNDLNCTLSTVKVNSDLIDTLKQKAPELIIKNNLKGLEGQSLDNRIFVENDPRVYSTELGFGVLL